MVAKAGTAKIKVTGALVSAPLLSRTLNAVVLFSSTGLEPVAPVAVICVLLCSAWARLGTSPNHNALNTTALPRRSRFILYFPAQARVRTTFVTSILSENLQFRKQNHLAPIPTGIEQGAGGQAGAAGQQHADVACG
jgi:hypothetical protein